MDVIMKIIGFITTKKIHKLVLIILLSYIAYKLISFLTEKIIISGKHIHEKRKRKTIVNLFRHVLSYTIWIVAILHILDLYGYNVKALVAGLGIAATVLGLALQDTIKDFIGGITILLENYYVTGDYIKYNDFWGEVVGFTLKSTKVKSVSGEVMIFANRNVSQVINLSQKEATVFFEIPVSYEMDVEKVEKVILEKIFPKLNVIEDIKKDTYRYLGVSELKDSCLTYMIAVNCKQEHQWQVKRDIATIVFKECKKNQIKIPYPQMEVHHAEN